MTDTEKRLSFLLATSPYLDTLDGKYEAAAEDLVANGVVPVVRCKDCKHMEFTQVKNRYCRAWGRIQTMGDDGFCNFGERKDGDG